MVLTHYIGGKITGDTADFDLPLSTNYPNLTTFINFETFIEYILVDGVWTQVGFTPIPPVGGWKEVGRATAGGAETVLTLSSIPNKQYYMLLYFDQGMAGAPARFIRLNGDATQSYTRRIQDNGQADITAITQDAHNGFTNNNTFPQFVVQHYSNLGTKEKLMNVVRLG